MHFHVADFLPTQAEAPLLARSKGILRLFFILSRERSIQFDGLKLFFIIPACFFES